MGNIATPTNVSLRSHINSYFPVPDHKYPHVIAVYYAAYPEFNSMSHLVRCE